MSTLRTHQNVHPEILAYINLDNPDQIPTTPNHQIAGMLFPIRTEGGKAGLLVIGSVKSKKRNRAWRGAGRMSAVTNYVGIILCEEEQ